MKKSAKIAVGVGIVAVAVAVALFVIMRTSEPSAVTKYAVFQAERGTVREIVSVSGTVAAKDEAVLFMKRTQTVSKIHVKAGEHINSGDTLISFDIQREQDGLLRQLEEAELKLANAELNLRSIGLPAEGNELLQYTSDVRVSEKNAKDAEDDVAGVKVKISQQTDKIADLQSVYDKNKGLYDSGAISQKDFEAIETALKSAKDALADLELSLSGKERTLLLKQQQYTDAQKRLSNAKNKLSDEGVKIQIELQENTIRLAILDIERIESELAELTPDIKSPVTGTISSVSVKEGQIVSKGSVLAKVLDLSEIIVEADVSEFDAPELTAGLSAEISASGIPDKKYSGIVSSISQHAVKEATSSGDEVKVPVRISLNDSDDKIKTGYSVDVAILLKVAEDVIFVPQRALLYQDNDVFVYVINGDKAEQRRVGIGVSGESFVEITDGLAEHERIAADASEVKK